MVKTNLPHTLSQKPLAQIIETYLYKGLQHDFIDIDVEGHDLEVLKSNDWERYWPKIVIYESHLSLDDEMDSDIYSFFCSVNYKLIGKTAILSTPGNLIFQRK